jgi:hypothetical protein
MIKRGLTLVNTMNITPRIRISDAAGPEAAGPKTGGRMHNRTGEDASPGRGTGACLRQDWATRI